MGTDRESLWPLFVYILMRKHAHTAAAHPNIAQYHSVDPGGPTEHVQDPSLGLGDNREEGKIRESENSPFLSVCSGLREEITQ